MIEIKSASNDYIDSNIDIDKSYQNMKKVGKYDKTLLVFQEQNNNIKHNYKEYITSINKYQNLVSIIFILDNTDNILSIINILNNKGVKATFFLTKEIFDNSVDLIKTIKENGNQVELYSSNYSIYEVNKYSSLLKYVFKEKLNFCININKDNELLKSCESSKMYSIYPYKIDNNLYLNIKNNLSNGLIIALDNSNKIVKELSSTINYILQKGKKIVLLKSIIE